MTHGPDEAGRPIEELQDLELAPERSLSGRVRRAIQRRMVVGHVASLGWSAPWLILLEFLEMIFSWNAGSRRGGGGS